QFRFEKAYLGTNGGDMEFRFDLPAALGQLEVVLDARFDNAFDLFDLNFQGYRGRFVGAGGRRVAVGEFGHSLVAPELVAHFPLDDTAARTVAEALIRRRADHDGSAHAQGAPNEKWPHGERGPGARLADLEHHAEGFGDRLFQAHR